MEKVISKFWSKLSLLIHPSNLEKHRTQWSGVGRDVSTSLTTYDDAWLSIRASSGYMQVVGSFNVSVENEAARVVNDRRLGEFL